MTNFLLAATPVYTTLFWAIVFISGASRSKPKLMLAIFMFTASLLYSCHMIYFQRYQDVYLTLDALYLFTSLAVYPLFYWYIKLLTTENTLRVYNLLHLAPALVLAILLEFMHIIATPDEQQIYYNEVLINNNWGYITAPGTLGWLSRIFLTSRIVFSIQVIYCLILGYRLASHHNSRIEDFYSNLEDRKLVWIKMLNVTLVIFSLTSSVFNILGRGMFLENENTLAIPSLLFSSLLFIIGIQGNRQRNTVEEMTEEVSLQHTADTHGNKTTAELKKKLNDLMVQDKIYLIPDLKIITLSKMLNTNRTYISNLINDETGCNFNTWVNRYRIEHALEIMNRQGSNLLVTEYIAQESGFGSPSSFIRAFKAHTGITPGKYLQDRALQQASLNNPE